MARRERQRPGAGRSRIDAPREVGRRPWIRPAYDTESFGRASEQIARFMGTGRFLLYMSFFIGFWLLWNNLAPEPWRFDPYTHTFLTLILSIQASYAAPLILLAQNRQDNRDRVNLEQDRQSSAQSRADMEFLTREVASLRLTLGEVATRDYVRSELRALLHELDERARIDDEAQPVQGQPTQGRPTQGQPTQGQRPTGAGSSHAPPPDG